MKNFLAITFLSIGAPMISMGDEVKRTQRGNNNAYCHDNELTWFDWTLLEKHHEIHRFVKALNAVSPAPRCGGGRRQAQPESTLAAGKNRVAWGRPPPPGLERALAFPGLHLAQPARANFLFHVMLNAYWEPLTFELPPGPRGKPASRGGAVSIPRLRRPTTSQPVGEGAFSRRSRLMWCSRALWLVSCCRLKPLDPARGRREGRVARDANDKRKPNAIEQLIGGQQLLWLVQSMLNRVDDESGALGDPGGRDGGGTAD